MNKTNLSKLLSFVLCVVLIAAVALFTSACNGKPSDSSSKGESSAPDTSSTQSATIELEDGKTYGEGETSFSLAVTFSDGSEKTVTVKTHKKTVGDALSELKIIDGEDGDYGLYVKTVAGETVDFDADGKYWAFYVDGEYAMSGVDTTDIVAGASYALKVE